MTNKRVLFHYNVPYDIHLKALDFEDYEEGILSNSTFASGLKKGFEANGYELEILTRVSFFFNRYKTKNKYIYKYFFYLYLILFGLIDNYLLQRKILKLFRNKDFEIYFTELNPVTTSSFLKSLRSKNIKSIQWFGVFPKNLKFNKRPLKLLDQFDLIVSSANLLPFFPKTPKKFLEIFPVYKNYSKINLIKDSSYDILFIGSLSKIHSNRWDVLEHIYKNFENFGIFGYKIEDVPDSYKFKDSFRGSIWGEEYYRIIKSSKIIINLFLDDYVHLDSGLNLRVVEVIGNKSFLLTQYSKTLLKYFKLDKEIAVFYSLDDLKNKINFFLNKEKERQQIIEKGFQKVKNFTYKNQISNILNSL